MLSFVTDEMVWAARLEREEEARRANPHTAQRPDPERMTHEAESRKAIWSWNAPFLRQSAHQT